MWPEPRPSVMRRKTSTSLLTKRIYSTGERHRKKAVPVPIREAPVMKDGRAVREKATATGRMSL